MNRRANGAAVKLRSGNGRIVLHRCGMGSATPNAAAHSEMGTAIACLAEASARDAWSLFFAFRYMDFMREMMPDSVVRKRQFSMRAIFHPGSRKNGTACYTFAPA